MKKAFSQCLLLAFGLLTSALANAQFVGDVFAKVPSIAALPGSVVSIEADLFSGANVFGAASVELTYDDAQISLIDVVATSGINQPQFVVKTQATGKVSFASLSKSTAAVPVGTVALALIRVKVTGTPGQIIRYRLAPLSVLRQDATEFSSHQGFSGEIVLVSSLTAAQSLVNGPSAKVSPAVAGGADGSAIARALQMRRPGSTVKIIEPIRSGDRILGQNVQVSTGSKDRE